MKGGFKISDLLDLGKEQDEKVIQEAERENWNVSYSLLCGYTMTLHFKEDTAKAAWWKQSKPVAEISEGEEAET